MACYANIKMFHRGMIVSNEKINLFCCCLFTKLLLNSFLTSWTAARQAPLSMGFSRQEY